MVVSPLLLFRRKRIVVINASFTSSLLCSTTLWDLPISADNSNSAHFTLKTTRHFVALSKTSGCLFLLFVRLLSFLFFFLFHWGLGCSHFHTEDDEALNLRFFFFVLLFPRLFCKNCPQNQSIALCGRRDAKKSTLVVRIQPQKGRRDGLAFFFDSSKSKNKNTLFCLLRSQSVFSRSSSSSSSTSFEEEVEKKSNGVVWLERIRLIGQRPLRRRRRRHHREGDAIIKKGFGALGTKR